MSVLAKINGTWQKISFNTICDALPIGSIMPYGGTNAPDGCMLCHGQALSRSDYGDLFDVVGTKFGIGDGSTTFNLPDLRESVPVGAGTNALNTIAAHDVYIVGQFKDDQMQSHTHTCRGYPGNYSYGYKIDQTTSSLNAQNTSTPSGRTGTTTRGKRTGVEYIIKVVK